MSEPLLLSFDVACPVDHAFSLWTSRIATWWPADHTVSGEAGLQIVLEGAVGGRIYEQTESGVEHDWGEVTIWQPPSRLGYRWHLRTDAAEATDVEIHFLARGANETRIEIEHRGWERLGAHGETVRQRNRAGWDSLLPRYRAAVEKGVA